MVVVDPPFITHAVWENYAVTTKMLLKKGSSSDGSPLGKVILTTLQENAEMLQNLLGAKPTVSKYQKIPYFDFSFRAFRFCSNAILAFIVDMPLRVLLIEALLICYICAV